MKGNSMKHSSLIGRLLAGGVICLMMLASTNAQTIQYAPVNPAFLQYQQENAQKAKARQTSDGYARGYVPTPVDFSHLQGRAPAGVRELKALPSSYDLRAQGKLTPAKNQNPWGTCWAFATFGSLESCLLTAETNDFSENNLANTNGFDYGYNGGGTYLMSMAYLARWSGPVNAADDPYPNPGHSPSNLTVRKHVQEATVIAGRASALDNTTIKQAVKNYGAVYVSMYSDFDTNLYFNATNAAFYYNGASNTDHAVTIVGWDDDYAAGNFLQTPAGNGAFIVRNSWGTNWGDHGYFYCSYYDSRMAVNASALFNNGESTTNYGSVYQYDPLGWVSSVGYDGNNNTAWGASIFTATNNETLRAVGFYTTDLDVNYQIYIYGNITAGNPRNGTLLASQSGSISYSGYHTVVLNTPAALSSGQLFSIVIRLVNSTAGTYPLAIQCVQTGYSSRATAAAGQTYSSPNGSTWEDLASGATPATLCLKVFSRSGGVTSGANAAVGDYDGDRLADPAIYEEANGNWRIKLSNSGYSLITTTFSGLGGTGRGSAPADYDGDGKADPAIYEWATGRWVILPSTANYQVAVILSQTFGGPGYLPAPADYDGDRLADPCVYKAGTGDWQVMLSTAGYAAITRAGLLGGPEYLPAPADYDGDRLADPAMYGSSTGQWTIMLSSANYTPITLSQTLGGAGYEPAPADYDGDGKADPAVRSETTTTWTLMLSTAGYAAIPVTLTFE